MARVRSDVLVTNIMAMTSNYLFVFVCYLICYAEEHHGVGGNLISRLNNGSMMDYTTLVIERLYVEVIFQFTMNLTVVLLLFCSPDV